jgi:predicted phosphodiesterase
VAEEFDYVLLGHTHEQDVLDCRQFGHDVTVLNPGSVGQPLDSEAEYAVIDTDRTSVELRSVPYDESKVVDRLQNVNVPSIWW